MKIIITSILDPWKAGHYSRLHQLMSWLSQSNDVTLICINDIWKSARDDKYLEFGKEFDDLKSRVHSYYLSEKEMSPICQEIFSVLRAKELEEVIDFSDFDVHLNYNSLISGYLIGKKLKRYGTNTVYDVADDLPAMIGSSPQIPRRLRAIGYLVGKFFMQKNIQFSEKVILTVDGLRESYNFKEDKTVTIPNGVDTDLFTIEIADNNLASSLGLNGALIIGYVGSLREWVNFRPLFEAVNELTGEIAVKILIVGGGDAHSSIIKMADQYGISDSVILTGTIPYSKIHHYISLMDAGTIPFNHDMVAKNSLPLKLFEYLSCGKPVISSSIEGITNAVDGNVFLADTKDDYVAQLRYLNANREEVKKDAVKRREIVKQKYSWSSQNPRFEKVLKEAFL